MMLILIDSKMPAEAKRALTNYGEVIVFATHGITYESISGHPDIFFCPTPEGLVVAPNLPVEYLKMLIQRNIPYQKGILPVGNAYPETARYNALATANLLVHNTNITDSSIISGCLELEIIHVRQGYARCNLVALPNGTFITCDHGIEKNLTHRDIKCLFVNPIKIELQGVAHGFFGGACGQNDGKLFFCGSLGYFEEKILIEKYVCDSGLEIIELYDGPPVDTGTIFFI